MSLIFPFAALRPTPESAAAVAAVPYDVVTTEEARALAAGNALSFLRVSRPELDLPPGIDPHGDHVYDKAAASFSALRSAAPLVIEDQPSFYVYRLRMGSHIQSGVAACFSIDEYDHDLIKKHEKTRPDKEDDRTRHMLAIGAQTGPVFLTYRASSAIDAVVARVEAGRPLFDLTAPDGIGHQVWRAPAVENAAIVSAFGAVSSLYIADGHHRAASAARTRRTLASRGAGEHDRVMAVAFPDRQVQVLPYNRVVRDLHGLTANEFLAALKRRLTVRDGGPATPNVRGEVAMYLAGAWHTLTMGKPKGLPPHDLPPHGGGNPSGLPDLDVDSLESSVLDPVLGIEDIRTDKRIDFVGGIRGTKHLEELVDSGKFAVAFSLVSVSVDDLMRVSDAGGIMPPKSTWFEPKLRDGLLSHVI